MPYDEKNGISLGLLTALAISLAGAAQATSISGLQELTLIRASGSPDSVRGSGTSASTDVTNGSIKAQVASDKISSSGNDANNSITSGVAYTFQNTGTEDLVISEDAIQISFEATHGMPSVQNQDYYFNGFGYRLEVVGGVSDENVPTALHSINGNYDFELAAVPIPDPVTGDPIIADDGFFVLEEGIFNDRISGNNLKTDLRTKTTTESDGSFSSVEFVVPSGTELFLSITLNMFAYVQARDPDQGLPDDFATAAFINSLNSMEHPCL